MALTKVTYVDGVTIIGAKNLNDIQDELIRQGEQQTADEEATEAALALKADKSDTYTKAQVDTALNGKADKSDTYTKAQMDASLAQKADKSDTYTKAEVNASLELKADKTETYTKAQVDSMIQEAVEEAVKESEYSNFEMKSVSGDFIHITDGAGLIPVKDLKIGIDAVQSGSGDPSPENIRPIIGWTGAEVNVNDVNQWDEEWKSGYYDASGNYVQGSSQVCSKNFIPVIPSTEYYAKMNAHRICYYDKNKQFIERSDLFSYSMPFTVPSNCHYIMFHSDQTGGVYNHNFSINYPSTDTDYHAYDGHVYSVTWEEAGTVFGGTLDVTNGKLTKTWGIVDFGDCIFVYNSTDHYFYTPSIASLSNKKNTAICTCYKYGSDDFNFRINANNGNVILYDSRYNDADVYKTAMTGQKIVYELAEPVEYDITAVTDIVTLLGENNIFADTGAVEELVYRISRQ